MSNSDIQERIDRLEEIAERLENGEVDLATAKRLREEADDHLEWLRAELDVEDGSPVELPDEEVPTGNSSVLTATRRAPLPDLPGAPRHPGAGRRARNRRI